MTHPRTDSPATDFSVALLDEFVALGLRDIVVCPGSRSQALALAAAEFERAGLLRLRVRIDERSAGFLALGLAVESGMPVALVTTSGTAVANLHPAVLEAHHSGVPLIVLTADRPESMRNIGANQTTDQPGMFGTAVQQTWDVGAPSGEDGEADSAAALARAAWRARGPVHLNLAFMEPLSAPFTRDRSSAAEGGVSRPALANLDQGLDTSAEPTTQPPSGVRVSFVPGTVVVAGTGAGPRAEEVARELGAPLLAEVTSGAHFGP